MTYRVFNTKDADRDLARLAKSDPKFFQKAQQLLEELRTHPRTGTGQPEPLRGNRRGQWSRRISQKHRLVYTIHDDVVVVLVLAAYGHYGDK